mgnify:CR=1 FL=1
MPTLKTAVLSVSFYPLGSFPTRDAQYFDQAHARDLGHLLQTLQGPGHITGIKLAIGRESG